MLKNPNLDLAGLFTSTLCALHCTAVPVLLSFGFIESSHWLHNELIEMVVIGSGLVIAFFSLFKEFKKHLSPIPMLLALVGFTILINSILHHSGWSPFCNECIRWYSSRFIAHLQLEIKHFFLMCCLIAIFGQ